MQIHSGRRRGLARGCTVMFLGLVGSTACGGEGGGGRTDSVAVTGRVFSSDNEQALEQISVTGPGTKAVHTDKDGAFSLTLKPDAKGNLTASSDHTAPV